MEINLVAYSQLIGTKVLCQNVKIQQILQQKQNGNWSKAQSTGLYLDN